MNLKLVALSMSVLGLISSPVFADTTTTTTTTHKHKHHKKHHVVASQDYKAMGALAVAPVATSSLTSMVLDQMNQNTNYPKAMPEWFNRIGVSGGVNVETKWGSRTVANPAFTNAVAGSTNTTTAAEPVLAGYTGENTQRLSINNGFLNVAADVNEWSKAFASLSYTDASFNYGQAYQTSTNSQIVGSNNAKLNLEQGYIRIANFDSSPAFLEVGKEFQDFGRYTLHPITRSMTQVLTETLSTSAKVGFITDMGVHGSAYTFENPLVRAGQNDKSMNYGLALGYAQPNDQLGFDVGAGYLYNLFGVNDIGNGIGAINGNFTSRVGGVSAYADVNYEAFTVGARYVTALQRFSPADVQEDATHTTSGAKPWAVGVQAGYDFNAYAKNQNLYVGYQASNQTVNLNLPRQRWLVGYGVDVVKNTTLSAEWDHDISYSEVRGGTGYNSNLVSLRAAVKFG
jgi:hypothetical protein